MKKTQAETIPPANNDLKYLVKAFFRGLIQTLSGRRISSSQIDLLSCWCGTNVSKLVLTTEV